MKLYMLLVSLFNWAFGCCYKPVIIVHGVLSEASALEDMKALIEEVHPGTNITLVHLYPGMKSFIPLQYQLSLWMEKTKPLMREAKDGIHLICHSQGMLIFLLLDMLSAFIFCNFRCIYAVYIL